MKRLRKFIERLATNPWLATLIILKELLTMAYNALVASFPFVLRIFPELPPTPHIDIVDFSTKVIMCILVVSLQRLVKRARIDQEEHKRTMIEFMLELNRFQVIASRVGISRLHFTMGVAMNTASQSFIHVGEAMLAREWKETKEWLVSTKHCKDEEEARKVLGEFYRMDMEALHKRVQERKSEKGVPEINKDGGTQ